MELTYSFFSQPCAELNSSIRQQFDTLQDSDFLARTHLFHGRYENLYLEFNTLPELKLIHDTALEYAARILAIPVTRLRAGFWLNAMAPGDITTAHTHDDDDELLSGVYYIDAPAGCGDLLVYDSEQQPHRIVPEPGRFVFFSPATLHEVTRNNSGQSRLSMAFNFGLVRD